MNMTRTQSRHRISRRELPWNVLGHNPPQNYLAKHLSGLWNYYYCYNKLLLPNTAKSTHLNASFTCVPPSRCLDIECGCDWLSLCRPNGL